MKKLINWIFTKPNKQEKPHSAWTIERNGWEVSAKAYNQTHNIHNGLI